MLRKRGILPFGSVKLKRPNASSAQTPFVRGESLLD